MRSEKQNVLDFSDVSFKKCFLMLLFRHKKIFMYRDIELTVESTNDYGYHPQCLKKVTALKQKDKQEFEDFCKNQMVSKIFNRT